MERPPGAGGAFTLSLAIIISQGGPVAAVTYEPARGVFLSRVMPYMAVLTVLIFF